MDSDSNRQPSLNATGPLSTFAFLIGKWQCAVSVREEDGQTKQLRATWEGRYILAGHVIADEFRMFDSSDKLLMLGMNYRAYDSQNRRFNMKWLEAISGTWLDLGPQKLGGVRVSASSVEYDAEFRPGELHRIRFSDIDDKHFSWRVDISTDEGKTWNEAVMTIRARRSQKPEEN